MPTLSKAAAIPLAALMFLGGGAVAGYTALAGAQTATTPTAVIDSKDEMLGRAPHVGGSITAINGTTITVTAKTKTGDITYAIDAAKATFAKDGTASTIASLAVGERIMALGTVSGTNVVATKVMSGKGPGFGERDIHGGPGMMGKGRGVMGKVTAVNGSTITVTGKDGKSYTVNAGSATVHRMITGSVSDVVVGDTIGVQGSLSGTTITAKEIMDDLPAAPIK